ncbi:MAG: hypothetical protein KTR26_18370 [Flammeovirgaceae bacterium]|nr:hypothetical protein [Flammeovirgaceae bacterium]
MKIYLSSHRIKDIISEIAQQLNVRPEVDCDEATLVLSKSIGFGIIKGISFPFGLALLMIKCE